MRETKSSRAQPFRDVTQIGARDECDDRRVRVQVARLFLASACIQLLLPSPSRSLKYLATMDAQLQQMLASQGLGPQRSTGPETLPDTFVFSCCI